VDYARRVTARQSVIGPAPGTCAYRTARVTRGGA
jgi:hypothetical protein